MKICESGPVICRASGQASADTLNETCPCLTCDHEAPIVAGAYCMAGNFVDRNTNQNGCGVRENASFTLNTVDRHAVAYDARHHCLGGEVSGTLQAKGEGGWSLNYINPVLQPLPENTVGIDLYNRAVTGNTAATLTKKNDGTSSGPEVAQRKTPDWIVRRLIPMECGRLQGFPDGWAEIEPLTDLRELPFWREVYTKDCEIKGKKPNRKMMQADSEEGRRALMRWHDGLHSRAAEYAMWGNGMALPNALFFVKNAFRELGKPPGEIKLGSLFDGSGTMPLCAAMCGGHPVWASEVEPYPIAVTKTHLPNMKHLGSVTDIKGFLIEPVDIITFGSPCQDLSIRQNRRERKDVKVETISKAIIAALLAAELASCTKAALMQNRITDLETQRDIYKSMYEDWKGAAGEVAGYADTLRDSLKARDRLDGKLLVEDAGDFLCTAYCTEKREHICGTGTGITASGAPVEADVTVAADPDVFPFGTILYIEDIGVRIVQDKGAGIQGKHLDVAVSGSHEDALNWNGYGTHRVWIIKEGE